MIRTAYAVRSFPAGGKPSQLELDELAHGLAYWAGTYTELPRNPDHHGGCSVHDALQDLPRIPSNGPAGPGEGTRALAELPNFASAIESVPEVTAIGHAISDHTALFARLLLSHPEVFPVPLVHCITAPAAMRTLLSFFDKDFGAWAYGRLWQVSSGIVSLFAQRRDSGSELDPNLSEPKLARDELKRRAVEHRDEHVIKLTEACLREDDLRPDPVYRIAAEAVLERMQPWS
jgi:hypothetical protein